MEQGDRFAIEKEIKSAVEIGNPWALDEVIEEVCGDHRDLANTVMEIVVDEYKRRLREMCQGEMLELYQRFYLDQSDANKDWLLGELVEAAIREN
jgi:hypothetical protein